MTVDEPRHCSLHSFVIRPYHCQQPYQPPRRLRSSALPFPLPGHLVIGKNAFTESAILVLHGTKPVRRFLAVRPLRGSYRFERPQHTARAVNIIHAPTTEP